MSTPFGERGGTSLEAKLHSVIPGPHPEEPVIEPYAQPDANLHSGIAFRYCAAFPGVSV